MRDETGVDGFRSACESPGSNRGAVQRRASTGSVRGGIRGGLDPRLPIWAERFLALNV